MIGDRPTGQIPKITISAVAHEGLTVTVDGQPGQLAIVDETGHVVAVGAVVAQEAESVAINCYRALLRAQGHLRQTAVVAPNMTRETCTVPPTRPE